MFDRFEQLDRLRTTALQNRFFIADIMTLRQILEASRWSVPPEVSAFVVIVLQL
jgi:hypothetical protein